jgi:hypothetical protein
MRAMDADKTGSGLVLPVLVALCGSLLGKNTRGGKIIVGALNLGGSIEMIPNAVSIAELAIDKQAQTLLMPVAARRQLNDLPDDLWTRISIEFYQGCVRCGVQGFGGIGDECLNGEIFYSLREAQVIIGMWREHYNTVRPHRSLGYRPSAPVARLEAA